MTARRTVTRTQVVTTEHRVEFTAEELRKRLRLPEDAVLYVGPEPERTDGIDLQMWPLIATWTTTATKEPK